MSSYRKINKIIFDDNNVISPVFGEYAIYDGTDLMIIKEEDMSVRIINTDEREFQLILSSEKVKHPLRDDDDPSWYGIDDGLNENGDSSDEVEDLLETLQNYMIHLNFPTDELQNEISKTFSIQSTDGDKFQIFFGIDIIRKKMVPFLEIQNKDRKIKKTVFKTHLNKTNVKKIFNSIKSLKHILDKQLIKKPAAKKVSPSTNQTDHV